LDDIDTDIFKKLTDYQVITVKGYNANIRVLEDDMLVTLVSRVYV